MHRLGGGTDSGGPAGRVRPGSAAVLPTLGEDNLAGPVLLPPPHGQAT